MIIFEAITSNIINLVTKSVFELTTNFYIIKINSLLYVPFYNVSNFVLRKILCCLNKTNFRLLSTARAGMVTRQQGQAAWCLEFNHGEFIFFTG